MKDQKCNKLPMRDVDFGFIVLLFGIKVKIHSSF